MSLINSNILLQDALKNNGKITRERAIELIGHHYYHNGPKYVSEVITRMVISGKLIRVGRGNYEVGKRQLQMLKSIASSSTQQIKLL